MGAPDGSVPCSQSNCKRYEVDGLLGRDEGPLRCRFADGDSRRCRQLGCRVRCGNAECGTKPCTDSLRCPRRKGGQTAEAVCLSNEQESETSTRPGKDAKPRLLGRVSRSGRDGVSGCSPRRGRVTRQLTVRGLGVKGDRSRGSLSWPS